MWTLEHEGNLFAGRRVWLKPGTSQLFGRTNPDKKNTIDSNTYYIDDKRVSRKHVTIAVAAVSPEDGTKLHHRSQVQVTDHSKFGTSIDDGERFAQDTRTLSGTEHRIKIGSLEECLIIKWLPVVLTFTSVKKPYSQLLRLHETDIKTSSEFIAGQTTHVVSSKRNIPKSLEALVNGKHIVTEAFLDAIVENATAQDSNPESYIPSPLELHFDPNWPNEGDFIPPVGQEPVPRAAELFRPDTARSELFSGLTFIFFTEDQFDNLQATINGGGGKALQRVVQFGETTVDEVVEYAKSISEKKGRGRARANGDRKPIVVVRIGKHPDQWAEWVQNFMQGVDRALDQRSVNQNEFLDVILTKDVSSLRQPLPEAEAPSSAVPPSTSASNPEPAPAQPSQEPDAVPASSALPAKKAPTRRIGRRAATTSRFAGFDDFVPQAKTQTIIEDEPMEDIVESQPVQESIEPSQARSRNATQKTATQTQGRTRSALKRSPPEDIDESALMDEIFPAAAAIKRRRLEERQRNGSATPGPDANVESQRPKGKAAQALEQYQKVKKKAGKDIDVRDELARLRRAAEEESARRQDDENLKEALEGMELSEIRGLAQVEEMEVQPRERRAAGRNEQRGERWDERWNGRKNFKKFKRRGQERGPQSQKVIVSLEEVPQKRGFGLGEAYFLEEVSNSRNREEETRSRKRTGRQAADEESDPEPGFSRRSRGSRQSGTVLVEDSEPNEEEVLPEEIAGTPRSSKISERVAETQQRRAETQTQRTTQGTSSTRSETQASAKGRGKRSAFTEARDAPPAKKSKTVRRREEDSDDEETGFRFRRRGR